MTFKAGDRVVCVYNMHYENDLTVGKEYTVIGKHDCGFDDEWHIDVDGESQSYQGKRFKLVERAEKASSSVTALVSVLGKLYAKEDVEKALAGLQTYCVEE